MIFLGSGLQLCDWLSCSRSGSRVQAWASAGRVAFPFCVAPIHLAAQEPLCVMGTFMVLTLERFQADFMFWEATFKAENSRVAQQMPDFPELICPVQLVPSPLPGAA